MSEKQIKIWRDEKIAWYASEADKAFWDSLWLSQISTDYYAKYSKGDLEEYSPVFTKFLYKDDHILEAGCGTGRFVVALQARGYKHVRGIDWGRPTIDRVKTLFPELSVEVGDATRITVEDNYYDAYISLGVVEHRQTGPEPFLNEAYRILKPGGLALISVPYINPLRNLKSKLGFYRTKNVEGHAFYQYAFRKDDFEMILNQSGFNVIQAKGIYGIYAIKDELPLFAYMLNHIPGGWRVEKLLKRWRFLDRFGHMILFVCIRQGVNN